MDVESPASGTSGMSRIRWNQSISIPLLKPKNPVNHMGMMTLGEHNYELEFFTY